MRHAAAFALWRATRDAADGFPREFWLAAPWRGLRVDAARRRGDRPRHIGELPHRRRAAGACGSTQVISLVAHILRRRNRPGGYFEVQGQTHTSLVRHMDTSECAARCVVVDDPREADLLVAERTPPAAKASGQLSVHMTAEAKWLAERAGDFDLSMDMSLEANVPLPHVPARFAERIAALPPPAESRSSVRTQSGSRQLLRNHVIHRACRACEAPRRSDARRQVRRACRRARRTAARRSGRGARAPPGRQVGVSPALG